MSVVLFLDSLLSAAPIVCGFFVCMSGPCLVILNAKKRAGSFTLNCVIAGMWLSVISLYLVVP